MTKAEIVNWIMKNKKTKLSKTDISKIVNEIFKIIHKELLEKKDNKKIKISGFGTFIIKKRAPKIGRNPKTKEEKIIPERFVITFKAGKKLLNRINSI
ncbi:MAG: DNA-binding protein [Hydrogenothermus sp.]|nr:MAG: DNA-binding protein [Hydrogenothermus sp.]